MYTRLVLFKQTCKSKWLTYISLIAELLYCHSFSYGVIGNFPSFASFESSLFTRGDIVSK